jgi:alpha 1,2-mannosyltransferase
MQVIFLDSDNVAVGDPTTLFETEEYVSTGALLWPDYWDSSAAPDLRHILKVPQLPRGTFESGQMVFDKERCGPSQTRPL